MKVVSTSIKLKEETKWPYPIADSCITTLSETWPWISSFTSAWLLNARQSRLVPLVYPRDEHFSELIDAIAQFLFGMFHAPAAWETPVIYEDCGGRLTEVAHAAH